MALFVQYISGDVTKMVKQYQNALVKIIFIQHYLQ